MTLKYENDVRVRSHTSNIGVIRWQIKWKRGSFGENLNKVGLSLARQTKNLKLSKNWGRSPYKISECTFNSRAIHSRDRIHLNSMDSHHEMLVNFYQLLCNAQKLLQSRIYSQTGWCVEIVPKHVRHEIDQKAYAVSDIILEHGKVLSAKTANSAANLRSSSVQVFIFYISARAQMKTQKWLATSATKFVKYLANAANCPAFCLWSKKLLCKVWKTAIQNIWLNLITDIHFDTILLKVLGSIYLGRNV